MTDIEKTIEEIESLMTPLTYIDIDEMKDEWNRVKMCYAFLTSQMFFHQEIGIYKLNDSYTTILFEYHTDYDHNLPVLEDLIEMVISENAYVVCTGSYSKIWDRTMQLIALPRQKNLENTAPSGKLMLVSFMQPFAPINQDVIIDELKKAYRLVS